MSVKRSSGLLLVGTALTLASIGCNPTPVPPPARPYDFSLPGRYRVEGTGTARINDLEMEARRFRLELVDDGGTVTVQRFAAEIRDFDIVRHFLFIETARERFRCTEATNVDPLSGTVDADGNLRLAAGAAMQAVTYEARGVEGSCPGTDLKIRATGTSDREVTGLHQPGLDRFRLDGTFRTTIEGETLDMRLSLEGHYINRPPLAVVGVDGPGYDLSQGGCPPLVGTNPPAAEANHPGGLQLTLISSAYDPDANVRTDLATESWSHWEGLPSDPSSPYRFLGHGRVVGPVLFRFAAVEHFLRLDVTDRYLAQARAGCRFRVADTTPPTVTAPASTSVACDGADGARPASAGALGLLLASSAATDLVDPAPAQLPALLGETEIDDDTLFAPGTHQVVFRYQDFSGNVGSRAVAVEIGSEGSCG